MLRPLTAGAPCLVEHAECPGEEDKFAIPFDLHTSKPYAIYSYARYDRDFTVGDMELYLDCFLVIVNFFCLNSIYLCHFYKHYTEFFRYLDDSLSLYLCFCFQLFSVVLFLFEPADESCLSEVEEIRN